MCFKVSLIEQAKAHIAILLLRLLLLLLLLLGIFFY